jgi:hypothetical protein
MLLDRLSAFIARYRGLPTMIAVALIIVNLILQFFPGLGWLVTSNLLLHLGIIIGFIGLLLAEAVG